jgi:hypothetical protein
MDCSCCGFDRVSSRPAKIVTGAKKAAYYLKTRHSPPSLARRFASPLFQPAASSCHEVLMVAQLDKAGAACAEADTARPEEGRDASRELGSDDAGGEGVGEATRAAIARAYEVDRGGGGGESGAREGSEGWDGGGADG